MSFDGDLYPTAGATSVMNTKGDMVDFDTIRQRLAIGSANQLLQVKSSLPSWETVPLADTVLTTAGDILYENATPALARLASGTQYNTLQMGATLPAWSASATSVLTTTGDLLYASAGNTLARLAGGTSGDVLTANGAGVAPSYQTAGGGGAWTSEGTYTAPDDLQTDFTITLNNAFDEDKAELFIAGNCAQTSSVGQDWTWRINGITSGDYADSKVESDNGGSIATGVHSNANEFNLSNQYNPDYASFRIWAYVTQDESDNLIPHGWYNFEGSGANYSKFDNTRYGAFHREVETTTITSLTFFMSGSGKFRTGSTASVWSLAKS